MQELITTMKPVSKRELVKIAKALPASYKGKKILALFAKLKMMNDFVEAALKEIKPLVRAELKKQDDYADVLNMELTVKAGRSSWDFSGNPEWVQLSEQIKELEGNMKKVAESVGIQIVDEDTGELIPPAERKLGNPAVYTRY